MKRLLLPLTLITSGWALHAQVLDLPTNTPPATQPPAAAPAATPGAINVPSPGDQANQPRNFLGTSVPVFDPSSELLSWDGRNWNINDNRLFQARFEKYLNAPESETAEDKQYRALLRQITEKLAPASISTKHVDEAFSMLPRASAYEIDAHLCEGIADAVYSAWRAMRNSQRLTQANTALEEERKRAEWNTRVAASTSTLDTPPRKGNDAAVKEWARMQKIRRDANLLPYTTRLAEVLATIKANQVKKELSELQTKVEFQSLILQLFFQRRFEHVIIASRFYRAVFSDGNTTLKVGKDSKDLFKKATGSSPTVSTLDALANEAIRDAREGVLAYEYLLSRDELESATKRLAEAFTIGEYMPELRTLSREKKRQALEFTQKAYKLTSALEVKDYTLALELVNDLHKTAKDFDSSKPMAAIETARTVAAMHIAKARNAAVSGDSETLEKELKAATEIWPRNPALSEVSGRIFDSADVQQKALADLEQLLAQRNHRQIYKDHVRFIAATALYPAQQEKLKAVLEEMQQIDGAIIRSREIAKYGDYAGAWENVERIFHQYPQDTELNQIRADLTTQAADFVRTLRTAQDLEKRGETGSSLAWYLKAQKLYPGTQYGREGIERLVKIILPEESPLNPDLAGTGEAIP